jgi:transposase
MSTAMEEEFKRWTAKRKASLVTKIIRGKTTVAETSLTFDLPPSESRNGSMKDGEGWSALQPNLWTSRNSASGRSKNCRKRTVKRCWSCAPEKIAVPAGRGRETIETIRQGIKQDGFDGSISKVCQWFAVLRRTVYYKPFKGAAGSGTLCRPYQDHDHRGAVLRLPDGGAPAGQIADIGCAPDLISDRPATAVIADKGYGSDASANQIERTGASAVIPTRSHHRTPRSYGRAQYKSRALIERFFNRLKNFRRVATRYDKLVRNFHPFVQIAMRHGTQTLIVDTA